MLYPHEFERAITVTPPANKGYRIRCPKCNTVAIYALTALERREAAVALRENQLREREQLLTVRESEHEKDVKLIRNCLHPDRHPDKAERYTKALLAFDRLLESSAQSASEFNDDMPF